MEYAFTRTSRLEVGYLEWNPDAKRSAILLHGWPDSAETWRNVGSALANEGLRVIAPALRGHAPTRFRDSKTPRTGQLAALGRDVIELVAALHIDKPVLVGHDWGARAAANACGLEPGIASHLVMVSVGYGTNDPSQPITYAQAHNYWYHWFMTTERGTKAVQEDRRGIARYMWEHWGPKEWITDAQFDEAARAFESPDWPDVVLHSYRHRWGHAPGDPAYAADDAKLTPAPVLSVPTLVLHGKQDKVNLPESSDHKERFFSGSYERMLLDGVGHFPQRENPGAVSSRILHFVR